MELEAKGPPVPVPLVERGAVPVDMPVERGAVPVDAPVERAPAVVEALPKGTEDVPIMELGPAVPVDSGPTVVEFPYNSEVALEGPAVPLLGE